MTIWIATGCAALEDQTQQKKLFTLFEGSAPHLEEGAEPQLPHLPETGTLLAEARQRLNLTVSDVASALYLSEHYITAIENRDYGALPSIAYVTGYVRSYANLVNVDAEELIKADPDLGLPAIDDEVEANQVRVVKVVKDKPLNLNNSWLAILTRALPVLAILTILLVAWNFWDDISVWWTDRIKEEKIIQIEEEATPPTLPEDPQRQIGLREPLFSP